MLTMESSSDLKSLGKSYVRLVLCNFPGTRDILEELRSLFDGASRIALILFHHS